MAAIIDQKGEHPAILDVSELLVVTDLFVIATGTSRPHLRSLVDEIEAQLKVTGERPLRTPMDGLRPSTDQKVGDSSSSGRARDALAVQGLHRVAVPALFARSDFGSHSLHCDPNRGSARGPEPPNP